MPRLDEIFRRIATIDGFAFQDLGIVLLKKDYPNLNAIPPRRDLGQDAVIAPFLSPAGLTMSVAISKENTWSNFKADCRRCKDKGHKIDAIVFLTAGSVTNETRQIWKENVRSQFCWDLEVHDEKWIRSLIEHPDFEASVETILGVPPPYGDFSSAIIDAVNRETTETLLNFSDSLPRVGHLQRPESTRVSAILGEGGRALVLGEAGTGKSGLLREISAALEQQGPLCYLDSRRVAHLKSDAELSGYFRLRSPLAAALRRVAINAGRCSLIVDQLESVGQLASSAVVHRLLEECAGIPEVAVVTACRPWDLENVELYRSLVTRTGFKVIESLPLEAGTARQFLLDVGVPSPSEELVELGRNLLHLSVIIDIVLAEPAASLSSTNSALALWDKYREALVRRERTQHDPDRGRMLVAAAAELAKASLQSEGGGFTLGFPTRPVDDGLLSLRIIYRSALGTYHFRHEQMRDYFYAWHASEIRQLMAGQVASEIHVSSRQPVLDWMLRIYEARYPSRVAPFAKEVLGV